jgi:hypothetical protein
MIEPPSYLGKGGRWLFIKCGQQPLFILAPVIGLVTILFEPFGDGSGLIEVMVIVIVASIRTSQASQNTLQ